MTRILLALVLLFPAWALAQDACPEGKVCVDQESMQALLQLARDQKCRTEQAPKVTTDDVTIVVDRMGRVYGSGTGARPFTVKMDWCNYQLEAKTELKVSAAQRVEPDWGFRLRLKPTFGFLVTEAFRSNTKFHDTLDAGVLIEPFYLYSANVNAYLGLRSVGIGLGLDVTKNMTIYLGYSMTWGSWRSSPYLGVGFSLW